MSTTDTPAHATRPADAVVERLNDPAVAASLVTLLDNAELLSTMVLGLSGVVSRSEFIMDSVAEGINDLRRSNEADTARPSFAELQTVASELAEAAPALREVLGSAMIRPETIALLSTVSEAAIEGSDAARANGTKVSAVGLVKATRDDDVQRGLGMVIEIARALGRRMDAGNG